MSLGRRGVSSKIQTVVVTKGEEPMDKVLAGAALCDEIVNRALAEPKSN